MFGRCAHILLQEPIPSPMNQVYIHIFRLSKTNFNIIHPPSLNPQCKHLTSGFSIKILYAFLFPLMCVYIYIYIYISLHSHLNFHDSVQNPCDLTLFNSSFSTL
jgi:hypothetical protein